MLGTGLLVSENHDGGLEARRARATHKLTFYIYNVCINYFLSIFFFTLIFFLNFAVFRHATVYWVLAHAIMHRSLSTELSTEGTFSSNDKFLQLASWRNVVRRRVSLLLRIPTHITLNATLCCLFSFLHSSGTIVSSLHLVSV